MASIGAPELIIVLVLALLVLGPKRLPDAGRSIGKGMREFKDAVSGATGGDKHELNTAHLTAATAEPTPVPAAAPAQAEAKPLA